MAKKARRHVDDLRGASKLALEATVGVMGLVEAMHRTIAGGPDVLGRPLEGPARVLTGLVYGGVRGVTRLVGGGVDLALAQLAPLLGESVPGPDREAVLSVLNGVLGDYLDETKNPLAISMELRRDGHPLELSRDAVAAALPDASARPLILVHGSSMSDLQWSRLGHDHGAALAKDLGYTPVYVRYNSGLHVSKNGRSLAAALERLVLAWPVPVSEIAMLAHSMGGLVARSACHYAEVLPRAWRSRLSALAFLGTPHHGAPLERGGNWVDRLLGVSRYSAPLAKLGRIRSAGVTDLRFGSVLDEDWDGKDRFEMRGDPRTHVPLPDGVRCFALAGNLAAGAGARFPGDGLVPVDSALGRHARPERTLAFPEGRVWIARGVGHLDLLSSDEVYAVLRTWLGAPA